MNDDNCPGCKRQGFDLDPLVINKMVDEIPIAPSLKAAEDVQALRLSLCLECDAAREEVLCAHCGCFIRFRIRSRLSYCPHPAGSKWTALD